MEKPSGISTAMVRWPCPIRSTRSNRESSPRSQTTGNFWKSFPPLKKFKSMRTRLGAVFTESSDGNPIVDATREQRPGGIKLGALRFEKLWIGFGTGWLLNSNLRDRHFSKILGPLGIPTSGSS